MKNWKKSKIVMLPTEKASPIWAFKNGKPQLSKGVTLGYGDKYQHLYILSDEEIKEGNWVYHTRRNIIFQVKEVLDNHLVPVGFGESITLTPTKFKCKKIIATTDESLTIDGFSTQGEEGTYLQEPMPRPSNEFLKKYCELGRIDEVLVEYSYTINKSMGHFNQFREYKLKVAPDNTITIKPFKESWSREEVKDLIKKYSRDIHGIHHSPDMNDWIKENL